MAFRTMYPPQKDSPSTFLLGDISAVDTLMTVASAAALPQTLPYPLTIGIDKNFTETVMVIAQNLGNNQLTITRGTPAYAWVAGSKAARVLRATDFLDVQDNIRDVDTRLTTTQGTVSTHGTDISTLKTTVGGAGSGLVKGLADEIVRATAAEGAESTRATAAESNLNTIKINRSELAQVITDWAYSADDTKVLVTITRYNASTQQTTQYTRTLPVVSDEDMGVMTPEAYAEITALRNDVNSLINLGGRFIGVSFATKAALNAYVVPSNVKTGDFTYVLDDETKSGSTTRYIRNGTAWDFTFVIEHDPIGLANTTTAGIVKSKNADGKTFVETDGTMTVVGWDTLKTRVTTVEGDLSALTQDSIPDGTINKGYTQTEKTKLAGIAAGATANSSDATLLNRANHTGTQAANTITGLADVAISGSYNDLSNKPEASGGKRAARFTVGTSTAGWTSANCDYLCDGTADQVEINNAITALPATGGEIVILDGTYNITAKIDVTKDNVSIRGNGNATILKRMFNSSVKEGVITLTGRSGCKIANLQIDGNKASYTNNNNYGICLNNSSNSNTITSNTCNNSSSGIRLNDSSNNTVTGNACYNNSASGISLFASSNNTVTGNTCYNNNYGIYLDSSSNDNTVTSNTFCNNNSCGIYLDRSSNDNTVTGNTCYNNGFTGICLNNSSNNNTVTGDTCIRGTGLPTDYTEYQHTIRLMGTGNSYNLIAMNNCMGKAVTNEGGTGNTLVNNKFNAT